MNRSGGVQGLSTGLTSHAIEGTSLRMVEGSKEVVPRTSIPGQSVESSIFEVGTQRVGYQDTNGLHIVGDDEEGTLTSQNTSVTSQNGDQEECEGGIPVCCLTPSSSHSFQMATKMNDSVKDAPKA